MAASRGLVVLVDDDIDFLELNGDVLAGAGYEVRLFGSPGEALSEIADLRPALVITDLMMDSLDSGFALARRVKSEPRLSGVPVLVVTSAASCRGFDLSPRGPADLSAMNADGFLAKPVAPEVLLSTAAALIEGAARRGP